MQEFRFRIKKLHVSFLADGFGTHPEHPNFSGCALTMVENKHPGINTVKNIVIRKESCSHFSLSGGVRCKARGYFAFSPNLGVEGWHERWRVCVMSTVNLIGIKTCPTKIPKKISSNLRFEQRPTVTISTPESQLHPNIYNDCFSKISPSFSNRI